MNIKIKVEVEITKDEIEELKRYSNLSLKEELFEIAAVDFYDYATTNDINIKVIN